MASKVLLRMSPSWPLSKKSRLIQHPPSTMLTEDALAGFPRYWLGLACLDLSVDPSILALKKDWRVEPKFQISSTCKSTQTHITSKNNTNSTRTIHTAIPIFYTRIKHWQTIWPVDSRYLCPEQQPSVLSTAPCPLYSPLSSLRPSVSSTALRYSVPSIALFLSTAL
jgi:hypothetical protein